ncbi:Phototropin-2 [Mortierella sp. AD031]|nr:Phototropin-2 [Mortierella sp. AD031]
MFNKSVPYVQPLIVEDKAGNTFENLHDLLVTGNVDCFVAHKNGDRENCVVIKRMDDIDMNYERKTHKSIQPHDSILPLLSSFQDKRSGKYCLNLPWCKGGILLEKAEKYRIPLLPERDARILEAEVIRGLMHQHGQGIIHNDLKPDNIFVLREDTGAITIEWRNGT